MRVLYFSRAYTIHDRRFLAKIAERHEAYFLRLEGDGVPPECGSLPAGVQIVPWVGRKERFDSPDSLLGLMPAFQRVMENLRPDLVHAGPIQSCGFVAALSGFRPFLAMSWGSDILVDSRRNPLCHWITQYTLRCCSMLACDCEAVANEARRLSGNLHLPTVRFPWGIDLSRFAPTPAACPVRNRVGWQDAVVVFSNRSWSDGYGIETLLEAFDMAHRSNPRLRLMLAGAGPMAPAVHAFIAERGLSNVVELTGNIGNETLPEYLRSADMYVSCASSDGTSISLLEAMATGLPVIVTDLPSNREWVSQPDNGWLCPDGVSPAFAEAMLRTASLENACRLHISWNNRAIAGRRADWNVNSLKLFEAYDALTSGPSVLHCDV